MTSPEHGESSGEKQPSPVRLDHAAIMTTDLQRAVRFYTEMLDLSLHVVEEDPIRKGRRRALLNDGAGTDVLEIIEMPELAHPSIPGRGGLHHLGFRLPQRHWHALRARLDASGYSYQEVNGCLFLRDADGLVLELEADR